MYTQPHRRRTPASAEPIAEPLSNREIGVLRLLATGLWVQTQAGMLWVAMAMMVSTRL
jgi:DNA-binding NarL/FixJ family response regulator